MLLAPMVYDDQVLGVLVLSRLGLRQFSDDDLRLLEIYASFAAQAFSNAEITQQLHAKSAALERQLRSQRDLELGQERPFEFTSDTQNVNVVAVVSPNHHRER